MRRKLMEKGLVSRVVYLDNERALSKTVGELTALIGQTARTEEALAEAQSSVIELESTLGQESLTEMGSVAADLAQVREQLRKLEDRVQRLEITARPGFESTYERMVSCIEAERGVILWTDFYRRGRVAKRLEVDPASIRAIGSRHIPFSMTMSTPRRRSETLVLTGSYEIRPQIPDSLFSTWNLEAGDADRDRRRVGAGK